MDSVKRNLKDDPDQLEGTGKPKLANRYSSPRLVEYGTLAKLTRGKVAGVTEGGTMSACL